MKRICKECYWNVDGYCRHTARLGEGKIQYKSSYMCSNWKPEKRGTCAECEFWVEIENKKIGSEIFGDCTKNAPTCFYAEIYNDVVNSFAAMKTYESCGQWMPKEQDK